MVVEIEEMKDSSTVCDLSATEWLRERLQKYGTEVLSEAEVLAVILNHGTIGKSVMAMVQHLLKSFICLKEMDSASPEDDIKLNKKLGEADWIMGVDVLHHIIVTDKVFIPLQRQDLF
jgi:DNA repair protein RadC